ncbi:hypothetical protein HDA32_002696 [Spinactinospora alkalitolerans]|uniref:Uncharacterized protein n=1 Tax=Spinactinospora alkalitolerans TaxID=687207 RepID=A0A852TT10_9ACTN|nr:hypothetical protein [Spinactinospora alkalitolerans]
MELSAAAGDAMMREFATELLKTVQRKTDGG